MKSKHNQQFLLLMGEIMGLLQDSTEHAGQGNSENEGRSC